MIGPFGDEIPGDWTGIEETSEFVARFLSGKDGLLAAGAWYDLHAKFDDKGG